MASIADSFDYTRGKFWGGPSYSYWMLIPLTIFAGFFGLDHFFLRSPTTGVLKFIVNIFGLGMWWIYDMLQIIGDKESVMTNGLTAPIVGPLGIAAGAFKDTQPDAKPGKSPFRYLLYLYLVLFPFGFDLLCAGDSSGAMMKFISTIIPFLWPILIYWMIVSIGNAYLMPKRLFTEGIDRVFPFTRFADPKGDNVLGPVDIVGGEGVCGEGVFKVIYRFLPRFLQIAIATVFPTVIPAVETVAKTVKVGANTATGVIEAVKNPAIVTAGVTSGILQQIPGGIAQVGDISSQVANKLAAVPTGLPALQTGGGAGLGDDLGSNTALLVLFSSILLGGTYYGFKRLNNSLGTIVRNGTDSDGKGRKRDDTPPQPQ